MANSECVYLGIDGGGTSTRAALAGVSGRLLGLGAAGPSNYDDVGVEASQTAIGQAVTAAWEQAGLAPRPAEAVFLGMAGVVSPADRDTIRGMAQRLGLAAENAIHVDHDIRIALAGGLSTRPGIALIAGTGSSCYGRNAAGESCRVGGWGHLLDDGGSGYFLGMEAMRAAVRSADGRLGTTRLEGMVQSALGLDDLQGIMRRLYHDGLSRAEIAGLARLALQAAEEGDEIAQAIMRLGQEELAGLVVVAARRLALEQPLVTITGGLVRSGSAYRSGTYEAIRRRLPGVQLVEPALPPVLGAVLLAMQSHGLEIDEPLIARLQEGLAEREKKPI